jgi:hypothetical protein
MYVCLGYWPFCVKPALARFSRGGTLQGEGLAQLRFQEPLSSTIVKQDLVAIGFPDRREPGGPGAVQAEVNTAGLFTPLENPFCHRERSFLELAMFAKGCMDVISQMVQAVNLLKTGQHFGVTISS